MTQAEELHLLFYSFQVNAIKFHHLLGIRFSLISITSTRLHICSFARDQSVLPRDTCPLADLDNSAAEH